MTLLDRRRSGRLDHAVMTADQPSDPVLQTLVAGLARGFDLNDAGRSEEALAVWDRLLAADAQSREDVRLLLAKVMHAKAYVLYGLDRDVEAETVAREAADLAGSLAGVEAQVVAAQVMGVRSSALSRLGLQEVTLEIDQCLVERYADSDSFALRLCAGRALAHEIWVRRNRKEEGRGIACAQRLVAMFRAEEDPAHLVEVGELLLSSAETLNYHGLWRRASAPVREQAGSMCDAVIKLADRVGGELGAAVAVSARIAAAAALARDGRVLASATAQVERPSVNENELPALAQVEKAALASGAEGRYLALVMTRVTTLDEVGRTDDALRTLDDLLAHVNATGGASAKGTAVLIHGMRKLIQR